MARYYEQKIKTGEIPCTAHRKGSYGLTRSFANKTQVVGISRPMTEPHVVTANLIANPACSLKPESKKPALRKRLGEAEIQRAYFPEDLQAWGKVLSCDF
jgi:hypothetical protein